MKWRARWSHVTIALAVIAALAIASPALGLNIKKLVKKEVSKQIAKATGPPGANGINGINGVNGTNGADGTAEVASPARLVFNDSDPGDPSGEFVDVISAGSFTIRGRCESFGGASEDATLSVVGPDGSSFSAMSSNGANVNVGSGAGGDIASVGSSGNVVQSGHAIAAAPNGQVVSVTGSVEVGDPAGHCLFAATAIGP
jgi:hypothetical protein